MRPSQLTSRQVFPYTSVSDYEKEQSIYPDNVEGSLRYTATGLCEIWYALQVAGVQEFWLKRCKQNLGRRSKNHLVVSRPTLNLNSYSDTSWVGLNDKQIEEKVASLVQSGV